MQSQATTGKISKRKLTEMSEDEISDITATTSGRGKKVCGDFFFLIFFFCFSYMFHLSDKPKCPRTRYPTSPPPPVAEGRRYVEQKYILFQTAIRLNQSGVFFLFHLYTQQEEHLEMSEDEISDMTAITSGKRVSGNIFFFTAVHAICINATISNFSSFFSPKELFLFIRNIYLILNLILTLII